MNELEIKDLTKSFSNNIIFKNISFNVEKGKILAVLGGSGSGKSTLIQCISFLEKADSGKIKVGEIEIDLNSNGNNEIEEKIHKLRTKIGVVFQDFNLWPHMTVLKNLIEAPIHVNKEKKNTAKRKALHILKELGLEKKIDQMPNNLSGGQKQRVALARALMMNPEIMLFDEPTSALDPNKVNIVINIIKGLAAKGMTIIVATHEISFAKQIADEFIFIGQKKIIEQGNIEALENPNTDTLRQFLNI